MTGAEHFSLLVSVIPTIILFLIYWIVLRPRTRLIMFRDDMFSLRDHVFDAMHQTKSSFDDPGYCEFRNLINGTIRISATINPLMIGWMLMKGYVEGGVHAPPHEKARTDCVRLILKHAENHYKARVVRFVFFEHATGLFVSQLLLTRSYIKSRILWWRALDDNRAVRAFLELAGLIGGDRPRTKTA